MAILASPLSDRNGASQHAATKVVTRRSLVGEWFAHPQADFYLVIVPAVLLLALGLMMVLSASSVLALAADGDAYSYVKRQAVFLVIGGVIAFVATRLSNRMLSVLAWVGLAGVFFMQLLTFSPLGVSVNGNRNWVQFGADFARFQPGEFAKLVIVLWAADVLARKDKLLNQTKHLLIPFLPVALVLIGLVVMQGDRGTGALLGAIVVVMLWVVGARWRVLGSLFAVVGVAVLTLIATSANRLQRIMGFLNPDSDPLGANHQPIRAMYALASGGWWGMGLGASRQKWGGLVEAHTDYILAVIGEELGLVGVLIVLALFLTMAFAGFRIAMRQTSNFLRYAAAGITGWLMIQALVNILVVLRLLPVIGVTLPFLSYGGSSMLANLIGLGVLLSCARQEPDAVKARSKKRARKAVPDVTAVVPVPVVARSAL